MQNFSLSAIRYQPIPPASQHVNGDTNHDTKMLGQDAPAYYNYPGNLTSRNGVLYQQRHYQSNRPRDYSDYDGRYQYDFGGYGDQWARQGYQQPYHYEDRRREWYGAQEEEREQGWYGGGEWRGRHEHNWQEEEREEDWYREQEWRRYRERDWRYQEPAHTSAHNQYRQYQQGSGWNSVNRDYYQFPIPTAAPAPGRYQANTRYRQERYAPHLQDAAAVYTHSSQDWSPRHQHELMRDYYTADDINRNNIIQSSAAGESGPRRSARLRGQSQQPQYQREPLLQVPQGPQLQPPQQAQPHQDGRRRGLPKSQSPALPNGKNPTPPPLKRPMPTEEYILNAHKAPQRLDSPRPLLVVLDLNGTLLYRKSKRGGSNFKARPFVNEFLDYIFSKHLVMVWSSARPDNVDAMCKKLLFQEQYDKLVGVWARDKLKLTKAQYNEKVQVYKQLSWVWSDPTTNGKRPWSQADTVLIDDSLEKAASEPHNIIQIEEFENRKDQLESDVLGQVASYLEELSYQKDVSAYLRAHPFKFVPEEKADTPMQ